MITSSRMSNGSDTSLIPGRNSLAIDLNFTVNQTISNVRFAIQVLGGHTIQ